MLFINFTKKIWAHFRSSRNCTLNVLSVTYTVRVIIDRNLCTCIDSCYLAVRVYLTTITVKHLRTTRHAGKVTERTTTLFKLSLRIASSSKLQFMSTHVQDFEGNQHLLQSLKHVERLISLKFFTVGQQ